MLEPIFLLPEFKDYLWGGTRFKKVFKKAVENENCTAESWEISTNENGSSIIKNGIYQNMKLSELYADLSVRKEVFGDKCLKEDKFPILIKYLDANDKLSVQVHPDDKYALEKENSLGKTEMWYILDCEPNAQIICGLKEGIQKPDLQNKIMEGKITDALNYIDIKKGDVIFIEAGTIHALLGGTLVCEIQQNSDLTYRVYDWDRIGTDGKKREIHVEKALDVTVFGKKPNIISTSEDSKDIINIVNSKYFKTDKIKVENEYKDISDNETFYAINIVDGNGILKWNGKEYMLNKGDSFIIPATLGKYEIKGELELLKTYI